MKKLNLLIVFLLALCQLSAQSEKIINGNEIDITDAPYIVSLIKNGKHDCGGVIINCEWILTAAHCISNGTPDHTKVHAGATDQTNEGIGQVIKIEKIVRHDLAMDNPLINEFDIGLIKLKEPLDFNDSVQPIDFATPENTTPADIGPGQNAFISGWGFIENSNEATDILRGVSMPIISTAAANALMPGTSNPVLNNFHVALYQESIGACDGDSGGPAIVQVDGNPMLVGIASRTPKPCATGPSIYISVRNFTEFIEDEINENDCINCPEILDYQLVDKDGNPRTVYCPGEDVKVNVLDIPVTHEYHIDLWTEDDNGVLDWISGAGWVQEPTPDGESIIDLFENDPENPVTFQEGITYVLKIAVATQECGWVEVLRSFTFDQSFIEPADYIFQDENGNEKTAFCVGEDIWVDGSPTIGENKYDIYAWRVLDNGDQVWFGNLGTFYGDMGEVNLSWRFGNLNTPKYFSPGTYSLTVAYYNDNECKLRTSIEKKFTVECCEGFLDASFTPVATVLSGNTYSIKASNFEGYENQDIIHEWYLMEPTDGSIIASSVGGFQYNQAEFGKTYFLIHKLRTPCGEICFAQIITYEEGGQLVNFGLLLEDCATLDLDCPATAPGANLNCSNGVINWNQVPNVDGYVLRIYYDQGACCGTPLGQPDEVVNLSYSQNSYYSAALADATCVSYQVGVLCEGETTWGPVQCKECCTVDAAPTDLAFNCLTNQGSFSPVPGAQAYVVEIIVNDRDCFCPQFGNDEGKVTLPIGTDTHFTLNPEVRCFSFRVGAICNGVTIWSDKECFKCFDVMPKLNNTTWEELKDLTVFPNPASSMVNLQVESVTEVNGVYTIHSSNGLFIAQQKGSSLGLNLDINNYPSGVYFINFIAENGDKSNVQRLVVTR